MRTLDYRDARDDAELAQMDEAQQYDEWCRDRAFAAADEILKDPDGLADALVNDDGGLDTFVCLDAEVRVHGKRLKVPHALVVALWLPADEAAVVRGDCASAIREWLANEQERRQ